ncbi:RHS repeat domain-containing protein [Hahella sp. HN01]|uniref:RHS repeat domain-containing protein n=1 Tax=Hahella sp. HN01 TaxID=2847262 RepID=UPI001C1EFBEE|nr:hypothetical protein [Hahella sp. HN01]MBU6952738.1 hypothetical protein [Hahella sp. HN01]
MAESDQIENTFLSAADGGSAVISGEEIDEFTGDVRWSIRELSLPGQGGMNIDIYRSYNLADHGKEILGPWSIDVPRVSYVVKYWKECKDHGDKGQHCWGENEVSGVTLEISGKRSVPLVIKDGELRSVRGEAGWKGKVDGLNVTAYSPDGKTYVFDQSQKSDGPMEFNEAHQLMVYASSVTDAYGNWIKYKYHRKVSTDYVKNGECAKPNLPNGEREKCEGATISAKEHVFPKQITTNDGRLVDFNYGEATQENVTSSWGYGRNSSAGVPPPLTEIVVHESTGNRVWKYSHYYKEEWGKQVQDGLKTVTLPDNTTWGFTYTDKKGKKLRSITVPSGATIIYDYEVISTTQHPRGVGQYSLSKRTLKGAALKDSVTTFSYDDVWFDNDRFWKTVSVSPSAKTEKVFWHTNNSINDDRKAREGQLYSVKVFEPSGGNPLRTIEYTYDTWGKVGRFYGANLNIKDLYAIKSVTPLMLSKVVVDGKYVTQYADFTSYYQPQTIKEMTGGKSRVTRKTYLNQQWESVSKPQLIGFPLQVKVEGDNGESWINSYSYSEKGRVESTTINGITESYAYHESGDLYKKEYTNMRGVQRTFYLNYFRGVSTLEEHPLSGSIHREVNPSGTVQWEEDQEGYRTYYEYDGLNRTTKVSPPGIAPTFYSYEANKVAEAREGSQYRKEAMLDGLGRPYLIWQEGAGVTPTYTRTEYDAAGRVVFSSYPSFNVNEEHGVRTTYDALNRALTETTTVDNGVTQYCYGSSCAGYLMGFEFDYATTATDAEGYKTATLMEGFGSPEKTWSRYVVQDIAGEDRQVTTLNRNKTGDITSVNQGGVTRSYGYYAGSHRLKTINEPERNPVTFTYDAAGNLRTRDLAGVGTTTYSYYPNNSLQKIDYPTGHDVVYYYYMNGLLKTLTKGMTSWSYDYTPAGNLDKETLTITVLDPKIFTLDYEYDDSGFLRRIVYPNDFYVEYDVNDLGQVTRVNSPVGELVNGVSYHPTGTPSNYQYGNGQVVAQTLNDRRFVSHTTSAKGGVVASNLGYGFDALGNITAITNYVDSNQSVSGLTYDGLGRLKTANGVWGTGSFTYDHKDNLISKSLGNLGSIGYVYDAGSNRLKSTTGIPYAFQYDGYGNVVNNGRFTMTYDHSGDMLSIVTNSSPVANVPQVDIDYEYDGHGLRALEIHEDKGIYQAHSMSGSLLYEEDTVNLVATNYVMFDGKVVTEIEQDIEPPETTTEPTSFVVTPFKDNASIGYSGGLIPYGSISSDMIDSDNYQVKLINLTARTGTTGKRHLSIAFQGDIPASLFAKLHLISFEFDFDKAERFYMTIGGVPQTSFYWEIDYDTMSRLRDSTEWPASIFPN